MNELQYKYSIKFNEIAKHNIKYNKCYILNLMCEKYITNILNVGYTLDENQRLQLLTVLDKVKYYE